MSPAPRRAPSVHLRSPSRRARTAGNALDKAPQVRQLDLSYAPDHTITKRPGLFSSVVEPPKRTVRSGQESRRWGMNRGPRQFQRPYSPDVRFVFAALAASVTTAVAPVHFQSAPGWYTGGSRAHAC